jgi:hypothetical protein
MATEVFLDAQILVDGVSISGQSNELNVNYASELLDETTFGATTRLRKGGLKTVTFEGSGFFESGLGSIDELMFVGTGESHVVTVFPKAVVEGDTGAMGFAMRGLEETYDFGGTVGALMAINYTFQSREII